ncbi:hypothetical protein L0F63_007151, partial [Massospora cicadina]
GQTLANGNYISTKAFDFRRGWRVRNQTCGRRGLGRGAGTCGRCRYRRVVAKKKLALAERVMIHACQPPSFFFAPFSPLYGIAPVPCSTIPAAWGFSDRTPKTLVRGPPAVKGILSYRDQLVVNGTTSPELLLAWLDQVSDTMGVGSKDIYSATWTPVPGRFTTCMTRVSII